MELVCPAVLRILLPWDPPLATPSSRSLPLACHSWPLSLLSPSRHCRPALSQTPQHSGLSFIPVGSLLICLPYCTVLEVLSVLFPVEPWCLEACLVHSGCSESSQHQLNGNTTKGEGSLSRCPVQCPPGEGILDSSYRAKAPGSEHLSPHTSPDLNSLTLRCG